MAESRTKKQGDLNALSLPGLYETLTRSGLDRRLFELARDEDLGDGSRTGDVTSEACLSSDAVCTADVVCREPMVIAGAECISPLINVFDPTIDSQLHVQDGTRAKAGDRIATLEGPHIAVLRLERTLLNVLSRLSGVATLSSRFVEAAAKGGSAGVYDTRKTTPGWRALEKYAVRCGGGMCHRIGLYDAMLMKDNHLAGISVEILPDFVRRSVAFARENRSVHVVQIECDTLEQVEALLNIERGVIDILLLDNMTSDQLRRAVAMRDSTNPGVELEASGGVNLETIAEIAGTGVDRISVGALTHQARSLDIALDIRS